MRPVEDPGAEEVRRSVLGHAAFVEILRAVRGLALPQAVVGGGAVRDVVWDALSGRPLTDEFRDVDVAYFDPDESAPGVERWAEAELGRRLPEHRWDVKNQASVHRWYEARFGVPVEPFPSLETAVGSWPETATAIAVRLEADDRLAVIAPLGLDDLLGMVWRHNPARATREHFVQRLAAKQPRRRWPAVRVVDA